MGRFYIKALYPQFLREKTTVTKAKDYRKCLRKKITLISSKILRMKIKLTKSNPNQTKQN